MTPATRFTSTDSLGRSVKLAVAVAALLVVARAEARDNLRFQRLSLADGLSQTTVTAIHQDHKGFMWFGTLEGLNRFDGYDFKVFQYDPADPGSLSQDSVRALVEGPDGVLWVGTEGGLDRFDAASGTFTHYRYDPKDPASLSSDRIRALLLSPDGDIWIGTDGGGLNRFDPHTDTFTRFPMQPEDPAGLSHGHVRALHLDPQGRVWVGTDGGGVDLLDPESGVIERFRHDPADPSSLSHDHVLALRRDSAGTLWIGTREGGLDRYEPETSTFSRVSADARSGLSGGAVRAILEADDGRLLVGTERGLNVWDPESEAFDVYEHDAADPYSPINNRISALFQDRGQVIWIGTFNGLCRWNPTAGTFRLYTAGGAERNALGHPYVTSFAETDDGSIWVGTMGGLDRFDRASRTFTHFRADPANPDSIGDDRIMSLLDDGEDGVWVGSIGSGLDRFDPETGRFKHYRHDPLDPATLGSDGVTDMLLDSRGVMWVSTYRGGLNRYDPETDGFIRYQHDPDNQHSLTNDRVVTLFEDSDGAFWVGTDGGGLNRFDPDRERFVSYRYELENPKSLSSDHAWSISEGPDGDLWIGTQGGGLNRWSLEDRRAGRPIFKRYLKADGLPSSTIYAILFDQAGNGWVSTNRGLSAFDPSGAVFRNFNTSHGLQGDEFNFAAALRTRDGEMLFGGVNGFNAFYPEEIRVNEHVPPVVLTSFLKLNQPVAFERPTAEVDRIVLTHRDSVISFEFAALDFTAPERNRYRYTLEGFDRGWVEPMRRGRVTYTNLDPGRYTFRVQAANNDGTWNREGLTVAIRAVAPPWATGWAYGAYTLVALTIVGAFGWDAKNRARRAQLLRSTNHALHQHIAERARAEQELRKLSLAVEQSPVSVIITDRDGRIDYVNPKFMEATGYRQSEVRGQSLDLLFSDHGSTRSRAQFWSAVRRGRPWRGEVHSRKKNGEFFWEDVSISPIFGPQGQITHLLSINEDLTVRKQYELRLLRQAHYDTLTRLPNRTLALDRLSRAVARNASHDKLLAVMFLDLDNFKIVNDTLGHSAGDCLLEITAQRLAAAIRDDDTVARLGGDEFLLVFSDLEDLVEVESFARRVLDRFTDPVTIDGREIFITASLGITIAPTDSSEPQVLLRNADAAMYRAKEAGRDAYRFFTPAMNSLAAARLQLESALRQALDRRELTLDYQPIIDTERRRMLGAEALLRWRNPSLGQVSPGDFIPVAEETGLIVSIGAWVIDAACDAARKWRSLHGASLRVAVNISARQLRPGSELVATVRRALERSGLEPANLELEVTEGALLDDHGEAEEVLRELNDLGVRLAIDDFGTGYSSLSYLRRFPFDTLKIDRSFIQDLPAMKGNSSLVRAIVAMASGLALEVVGEGVESETQLTLLHAMGCQRMQGFYFSRPLAADEFAALVARGGSRCTFEVEPQRPVGVDARRQLAAG